MSEDRERNPATNADTPDGAPKDAERPHSDVGAEATGRDVLIAGITPEELRALVPAETLQHALAASDLSAASVSLYRGPLPEASMLAEYETIVPGCASKSWITSQTKEIIDALAKNEANISHYAPCAPYFYAPVVAHIWGCS